MVVEISETLSRSLGTPGKETVDKAGESSGNSGKWCLFGKCLGLLRVSFLSKLFFPLEHFPLPAPYRRCGCDSSCIFISVYVTLDLIFFFC